jgi:hypothetical protein
MGMKKLMLLAVMAIVAVMAVPALASANWKDKGAEFSGERTIPTTGSAAFTNSTIGGVTCTSNAKGSFTIKGGSTTGKVTEFAPTLANCSTTGALSLCTLTGVTSNELPWALDDNGTTATITGVKITNTFSGGFLCPSTIVLTGSITVTPKPNTTAITSLELGGSLASSFGGVSVTASGTQTPVNASDSGTYGL